MNDELVSYSIGELEELLIPVVEHNGYGRDEARLILEEFIDAELLGKHEYGVALLGRHMANDRRRPRGPSSVRTREGLTLVDGGGRCAQLFVPQLTSILERGARKSGVHALGLRNATSLIRAGTLGARIAEAGLVGIVLLFTNIRTARTAAMRGPGVGVNVLSLAVPYQDGAMVYDVALTELTGRKLARAAQLGVEYERPIGIDDSGRETCWPAEVVSLMPILGERGLGLTLAVELIAGAMLGFEGLDDPAHYSGNNGLFAVAIAPDEFGLTPPFAVRARHWLDELERIAGPNLRIPGAGYASLRARRAAGARVEIPRATIDALTRPGATPAPHPPSSGTPMSQSQWRLREPATLRVERDGSLHLWSPTTRSYAPIELTHAELLSSIGRGAAPGDGAPDATTDDSPHLRALIEAGVLQPARSVPGAPMAAPRSSSNRPIFILGCPRSGTTLVRWIVDSHPRIHCPAETRFALQLREFYLHPKVREVFRGMNYGVDRFRGHVRDFFDAVMKDMTHKAGKERWAEKTPHYSIIPEFLNELFDGECQFVIVVRHGLDVVDSMITALADGWWPPNFERELGLTESGVGTDIPLVSAARIWAHFNSHLRRFKALHEDSCHVVRYEELVAAPERVSRDLFAFLGETMDDGLLERVFRAEHAAGLQDRRIQTTDKIEEGRRGQWERWPRATLDSIADILGPELRAWRYAAPAHW